MGIHIRTGGRRIWRDVMFVNFDTHTQSPLHTNIMFEAGLSMPSYIIHNEIATV